MTRQEIQLATAAAEPDAPRPDSLRPFLLGTVVGGLAGGVAGTLLSTQTRHLLMTLFRLVSRRLTAAERDKLRFELLLQ